jgi:hypothetical protein
MRSQEESREDIDLKVVDQRKYPEGAGSVKQRSTIESRKKAERIVSKDNTLKLAQTQMRLPNTQ